MRGPKRSFQKFPPGPDPCQTQMSQQPGKAGCYQCIATPQVETESASQEESGTASFQKLLKKAGYIRVSLGSLGTVGGAVGKSYPDIPVMPHKKG